MFFRDKLSNILRSVSPLGPGVATPAVLGGVPVATQPQQGGGAQPAVPPPAPALGVGSASAETLDRIHVFTPSSDEIRNYKAMNRELDAKIDKQRKRKKNALIFFGIGIFCTVMLGVGLFTPYNGTEGISAMQSLADAKGFASGLQIAQLAFAFSAVGFAIPIAMTAISLIAGLVSNNKINKFKKERALNNQLMLGVSSLDKNILNDKVIQRDTALLMVEERGQSWESRVKTAEEHRESWKSRVRTENRGGNSSVRN